MNKTIKSIVSLMMVLVMAFSLIPTALASSAEYYPACSSSQVSLVDALAEVGEADTSFSHRAQIAKANSISNYEGTASQNTTMLNLLKSGCLKTTDSGVSSSNRYSCNNYDECTNDGMCYIIIDNDTPLRSSPYKQGDKIAKLQYGTLVKVVDIFKNSRGNDWACIEYEDEDGTTQIGYIYTTHLKAHTAHAYVTLYDTQYGDLDVCLTCGHATAHVVEDDGSDFFEFDLLDVANEAVRGDYYESSSFWGVLGRVLVGEIPYIHWAADARDFVYDASNCSGVAECSAYLALDAAALLPLVGSLKIIAHSDDINKAILALPLNQLPDEVQTAYKKYEQVNWAGTYKGAASGTSAGGHFVNKGDILPTLDDDGNRISYRKYDINDKISGYNRDSARFVRGSDGSTYVTLDHFDSYVMIYDGSD